MPALALTPSILPRIEIFPRAAASCSTFRLKIIANSFGGSPLDGTYINDLGGPLGFYPNPSSPQTPTIYTLSGSSLVTYPDRQPVRAKTTKGGYPAISNLLVGGQGQLISCFVMGAGTDLYCLNNGASAMQVCKNTSPMGEDVYFVYLGKHLYPLCQEQVRFKMECAGGQSMGSLVNSGR